MKNSQFNIIDENHIPPEPHIEIVEYNEFNNANETLNGMKKQNVKKISTPYMTKYERARILGARALQIRYFSIFFY